MCATGKYFVVQFFYVFVVEKCLSKYSTVNDDTGTNNRRHKRGILAYSSRKGQWSVIQRMPLGEASNNLRGSSVSRECFVVVVLKCFRIDVLIK